MMPVISEENPIKAKACAVMYPVMGVKIPIVQSEISYLIAHINYFSIFMPVFHYTNFWLFQR